jgi:superfamily I DNA/RNA helicase
MPTWKTNISMVLFSCYVDSFSKENLSIFDNQKKEKKLDRFDLVILLRSYFQKYKKFETKREYNTFVKDKIVNKTEKKILSYSLMIFDEFQNYLPEQLQILKSCLNKDTKSSIYVGDIAQQVKLGTIRNFEEIEEFIPKERNIRLNKVYRNTKNILSFIQSLGYQTEISNEAKAGPVVVEKILKTSTEEIKHIKEFIPAYEKGSIGILSKDESHLIPFKEEFSNKKNIHVLTMLEAQGVEFDVVFLVGVRKTSFEITHHIDILPEHIKERERMQRDLLYVALTRAITELHVLGEEKLIDIIRD